MARAKGRPDTLTPGNEDELIRKICDHSLLASDALNALVRTAQRGRKARSILITRHLYLLAQLRKEGLGMSADRGGRALIKVLDDLIGRRAPITKTAVLDGLRDRADNVIGTAEENDEPTHRIDHLIAEVVPIGRIPALYAHYQNVEEQIAVLVATLPKRKGAKLAPDEEFAARAKFLDKLSVRNPSMDDINRVITLAWPSFIPLSTRRTAALAEEVRAGYAAVNEIVRCNGRLAVTFARMKAWTDLPLLRRVTDAQYGIMRAAYRFEPSRGFTFSTYASWWIRHVIGRTRSNEGRTIRIPVHQAEALGRLRRIEGSGEPTALTDKEAAKLAGINLKKLNDLRPHAQQPTSLEMPIHTNSDCGEMTIGSTIPIDVELPEAALHRKQREEFIRRLIKLIPLGMDRDIIIRRFGIGDGSGDREEETLREIGLTYGVTRERIRQREAEALKLLCSLARNARERGEI